MDYGLDDENIERRSAREGEGNVKIINDLLEKKWMSKRK